MAVAPELVLDREVRDWVLLPLTVCVLLMQLLRQYVTQVRHGSVRSARRASWGGARLSRRHCRRPPADPRPRLPLLHVAQLFTGAKPPSDASKTPEIRAKMAVARAGLLRGAGGFIPDAGFRQRRHFFLAKVGWLPMADCWLAGRPELPTGGALLGAGLADRGTLGSASEHGLRCSVTCCPASTLASQPVVCRTRGC